MWVGNLFLQEGLRAVSGGAVSISTRGAVKGQARNLTQREIDVIRYAADGLDARATAQEIGTSLQAVKNSRYIATIKLGADNVPQAVAMAMRRGLIQ